jgi:hypothetical protein
MIEQTRLAGSGETRLLRDPISQVGLAIIQAVHLSTIRTSIAKRAKVPRDNP